MSVKIMGKAWELDLETSELLVLLAMADHADHEGNNVRPSTRLIAWKTGFSERHVRRVIDKLVEDNILVVCSRPEGKPVIYRIVTENGKQKPALGTDKVSSLVFVTHDTMSPPPLTSETQTPDITMSPESIEPSIKLKDVAIAKANGNSASKNGHSENGKESEIKRDFIFDLVAILFFGFKDMSLFDNLNDKSKKNMSGRIAKISSWLRDLYQWNEPTKTVLPSEKVQEIKRDCQQFCKWYAVQYKNAARPKDIEKFAVNYMDWIKEKTPELLPPDPDCPKCHGLGYWIDKSEVNNHKSIDCECRSKQHVKSE